MKTINLIFSFRDWRKGKCVLNRLGHIEEDLITDEWQLELEDWQIEDLEDELNAIDLEFEIEEL